jgi:hypothetical protein
MSRLTTTHRSLACLAPLLALAASPVTALADDGEHVHGEPPPHAHESGHDRALPADPLLEDPPLVGYKDSLVYLRDPHDFLRLYPHAEVDLDAHGFFGSGVNELPAATAGVDLAPRFFVRHARFDLGGELWKRVAFDGGIELVANPAVDGSRVDGRSTVIALADAYAKLDAGRGLGMWLGVFQAPFSLENTTAVNQLAMMERNVAVRGFIAPGGGKALGVALAGQTDKAVFSYNVGVFGAETIAPGDFEQHFDGIGRIAWKPLAKNSAHAVRGLEIGLSGRIGSRNPRDLSGDAAAITTGQGFALWRPTHTDSTGSLVHVIPVSTQAGAGVDFRMPFCGFVLRGEAFYMTRNTREAYDGFQSTTTLRSGDFSGVGWDAELSWWPLQTFHLVPAVKLPRPAPDTDHLEVATVLPVPERRGLEVAVLGAGVNASYNGASRGGLVDKQEVSSVEVYQLGMAFSYWQSANLRFTVDANAYYAPASSPGEGSAVVPGNLGSPALDPSAHWLEEVGGRVSVMF